MHSRLALLLLIVFLLPLAPGCGKRTLPQPAGPGVKGPAPKGTYKPYTIRGKTYYPLSASDGFVQTGLASWYGKDFHGRKTANGETYNMYAMTAAHKILPMNTVVRVVNLDNGKEAVLRINDRGPFVSGRIVDLSYTGARQLGVVGPGTARVRLEALSEDGKGVAEKIRSGVFYVQVGAYTQRANAERVIAKLKGKGHVGSRMTLATIRGREFWRVQAGPFRGLNAARRGAASLEREFPGGFVIRD